MTCIDCIHYDLCEIRNKSISANPLKCGYKCPHFKDKSKFIELPCNVGDTVYMLNRDKTKVQEMFFDKPDIRCNCKKDDEFSCCMSVCNDYQHGICAYRFNNDFSEIGKTVFLTREEAEAKLKERENNA